MIRICHLLCPSVNEYDRASLNMQVAQQSDQVARVDFRNPNQITGGSSSEYCARIGRDC
jgi:hypothetical protein